MRPTSLLIALLAFCGLPRFVQANNTPEIKAKATIEKATVYRKNAKLTGKAKVDVPQGKSYIVLEQMCFGIHHNSIQVKLSDSRVSLLTAAPRTNYLQQSEASKRLQLVEDSLEINRDLRYRVTLRVGALQVRRSALLDNNPLAPNNKRAFGIEQVKQLMEFREREVLAVDEEIWKVRKNLEQIDKTLARYNAERTALLGGQQKPTGEIVLQVQASAAVTGLDIECVFVVQDAQWTPLYDLRSEGVDKPVRLQYKAYISQTAGVDWKQVRLTLSTANPLQNNERPEASVVYADFIQDAYVSYRRRGMPPPPPPPPPSPSLVPVTEQGLSGDVAPVEEEFAAMPEIANAPVRSMGRVMKDEGRMPYLTGSRGRPDTLAIGLGKLDIPTLDLLDDEIIEFEIELLQDIPADGQKHLVIVKEHDIPAKYEYTSIPRLDKGAFLLAKLTDYGQYNLLPGTANLFFEGTYLGQSQIDPHVATDTLFLSLGRDEKIVVKREKLKDLTASKVLGSNKRETYAYEITVRNNKNRDVQLSLRDQIPVSKNKKLEIKLLEAEGAKLDADKGFLDWQLKVPAGQSVKVKFAYSVKYPKKRVVYYPSE